MKVNGPQRSKDAMIGLSSYMSLSIRYSVKNPSETERHNSKTMDSIKREW